MMMKQAPRREEKNAPGGLGDKIRQCSSTEFYLYLHKHCILLVMICLYTYEGTQGEGLEDMQVRKVMALYTIILYKLQISSSTGIQFGTYLGSTCKLWTL